VLQFTAMLQFATFYLVPVVRESQGKISRSVKGNLKVPGCKS